MSTLIIMVVCGAVMAYFSIQNTASVTIHFLNYTLESVPLYLIVIVALLAGILISWIINFFNNIGTIFVLRGKEKKIEDYKKENVELTKRNHQLEIENAKLKERTNTPDDEMSL